MVDPITAAGAGAAAVFAQKVLEEAASQTGQALSAGTRRLVAWIRHRGDEDPKTGAAVAMVSADPIDQDSIDMLSRVLAARVAGDPELVRQLQELVAEAPEAVNRPRPGPGRNDHLGICGRRPRWAWSCRRRWGVAGASCRSSARTARSS
jgi:hypothetical protein